MIGCVLGFEILRFGFVVCRALMLRNCWRCSFGGQGFRHLRDGVYYNILGLYRENGKENGSYYSILGLYREGLGCGVQHLGFRVFQRYRVPLFPPNILEIGFHKMMFDIPAFQESSSCYAGFVVLRLPSKSGAIWRRFRCFGVKRDARTPCRRGTDFRSLALRESGPGTPHAVSVSSGLRAWFRLRSGCVSVTRRVGCRYSSRNRVSVTVEMVPVTPRTLIPC